jgi:hypothetical protein
VIEGEDTDDSRNKKEPEIDATKISDLAEDLKTTSISSKQYNMGFQNLYIMYQYIEDCNKLVSIAMLGVPCGSTTDSSAFLSTAGQEAACISILVLWCLNYFGRPTILSLLQTMTRMCSTRTPTKQQPCSKPQRRSKRISIPSRWKKQVFSGAQHFKLPFKVEPDYYTGDGSKGWEVQSFDNEDPELYDELDSEEGMHVFVLSVNLLLSLLRSPISTRSAPKVPCDAALLDLQHLLSLAMRQTQQKMWLRILIFELHAHL